MFNNFYGQLLVRRHLTYQNESYVTSTRVKKFRFQQIVLLKTNPGPLIAPAVSSLFTPKVMLMQLNSLFLSLLIFDRNVGTDIVLSWGEELYRPDLWLVMSVQIGCAAGAACSWWVGEGRRLGTLEDALYTVLCSIYSLVVWCELRFVGCFCHWGL